MDLSEKETREKIIDPWLIEDVGWKEDYIKREADFIYLITRTGLNIL